MLLFKEFYLMQELAVPYHRRDSVLVNPNKTGLIARRHKDRNDINYVNKDKEHKLGAMTPEDNEEITDKYNIKIDNIPMGRAKRLGKSKFVIVKTPMGIIKKKS
jgi:hypothetical protein